MHLNEKLNLVIPIVDDADRPVAYVHSTPIARETFEAYFLTISKTFSAIHVEGLGTMAGPRVAALILKRVAEQNNEWSGEGGVEQGLMAEIRRLTNVIVPGEKGWQTVPYEDAIRTGKINSDDAAEVENAIVFFIVSSAMHRKNVLKPILDGAAKLWGAQITSLNCTAFAASLPTLNEEENTGETQTASPVPY